MRVGRGRRRTREPEQQVKLARCLFVHTARYLGCARGGAPALRDWDDTFNETDFKITDGLEAGQRFKSLTIRKTTEIVAYGLPGELAPSLTRSSAKHVEADNYHKMMEAPDTVIIDVRNAYESAIGHFQPPPGGAELIDPKMRNSHEVSSASCLLGAGAHDV